MMNKSIPCLAALLIAGSTLGFQAFATTPTERFLETTQGRYAAQEKLDLKNLPPAALTELTADSLQRSIMLERFLKESPTKTADDKLLVKKATALLPKMQVMSRQQFSAMQNATFAEKSADVKVSVAGKQSAVIQFTSEKMNPQIRLYLLTSMRTSELVKQLGFKSISFVRDAMNIETMDL